MKRLTSEYRINLSIKPTMNKRAEFKSDLSRNYPSNIFSAIYKKNVWGGTKGIFYSGSGSHNPQVEPYAAVVAQFIALNSIHSISEIGCGDFNVTGKILAKLNQSNIDFKYMGYDVVKALILKNTREYGAANIQFRHKDSANGTIANADLLLIRQVLQHLDNVSIQKIVSKFNQYKYIIVSEHQPSAIYQPSIIPNIDKQTGASTRVKDLSGVYLEYAPFNCYKHSHIYSFFESQGGYDANINTYLFLSNPDTPVELSAIRLYEPT